MLIPIILCGLLIHQYPTLELDKEHNLKLVAQLSWKLYLWSIIHSSLFLWDICASWKSNFHAGGQNIGLCWLYHSSTPGGSSQVSPEDLNFCEHNGKPQLSVQIHFSQEKTIIQL